MNIVYLHTHDSGRCLQPYGYNVPAPSLMELACEGVMFRNAHCCAPTCSPSRAAMLTGVNAHASGMTGLAHRGFSLRDPDMHLASWLGRHGYETALSGVQHESSGDGSALGYGRLLSDPAFRLADGAAFDEANTARAISFLKEPHRAPFFLSLGLVNTHREFPILENPTNPDYVMPPAVLPDTPETRRDFARYVDSAAVADRCTGAVLEALEQTGLEEDTAVLFTTDHGPAFPHMKCNLTDWGTGVALILRAPGIPGGVDSDALVSHLDVYPTLCQLAGIPRPDWLEGHSLLPLLKGEREEVREELFSEVSYHAAYEPMRMVRTMRYKLVRRWGEWELPVLPNVDDSPSKDLLVEAGWPCMKRERVALYDLLHDPMEQVNLAGSPALEGVRGELESSLHRWMERTGDPLLHGPVPKPAGARIHCVDCTSNRENRYEP